ncbi:hypothetical protein RB614_16560 [Phytohabitans sp. ZYX-F-186]|uniref:Uncharacterized protein n=1 Tax=Phytohabitans maris TaxID=3071409 RepID=A0ABU0ZIL4_9ACTN|nr:hypothetical protein [Phytohabitans sp. ZYX-F-186]MDQ7906125.1 hypothetical protein [Phytohabitans sp. ZYX-F-186]
MGRTRATPAVAGAAAGTGTSTIGNATATRPGGAATARDAGSGFRAS